MTNYLLHTEIVSGFDCDVNHDGKTDALDAQAIIGYVAGENDGSSCKSCCAREAH